MTYLFLDTMIYLHYTWFEDIDWQEIAGDQDVRIVVPHITLNELDTKKDSHQSSKIKKRALKVINRLYECVTQHDGALKGSLRAIEFDESVVFDFGSYNLDKSKHDHCLLAAILEFQETHDEPVVLVTKDTSLRFKTHKMGITAKQLSDEYLLPAEEDPVVKENKKLKNKLHKLESAMPKLSLEAEGGSNGKVELTVTPSTERVIDVEEEMEKVRDKFPAQGTPSNIPGIPGASLARQLMQTGISQIPESEYERYNRDRETYFEQCHACFSEKARRQKQCCAELNLFVANDGGAPAEDVDLYMHFPDGFELYPLDDLPEEPKAPSAPQEPRSTIEMSMGRLNFDHLQIPTNNFAHIAAGIGPVDPFSIKKTNSYEVRDAFNRIKHGHAGEVRPLMVIFDSYESATSFQITYRISAANLPESVEGELNVVVKKEAGE